MSSRILSASAARRAGVFGLLALASGVTFQPVLSAQDPGSDRQAVVAHADRDVTLEVTSANWMDARVYLVRDGLVTRLGLVGGPGKATFTLPKVATTPGESLQLWVEPIGTRESYLSQPFTVDPGDVVRLQIENSLSLSSVALAPRTQ